MDKLPFALPVRVEPYTHTFNGLQFLVRSGDHVIAVCMGPHGEKEAHALRDAVNGYGAAQSYLENESNWKKLPSLFATDLLRLLGWEHGKRTLPPREDTGTSPQGGEKNA